MISLTTLALALVPFQTPPESTAWGQLANGLRLGLVVSAQRDGLPIIDCYLKNETDASAVLDPGLPGMMPAVPTLMLTGKQGSWSVTPPSAVPLMWDGPSYSTIIVPAHMTVRCYSSRFYFPVTAGTYDVSATYKSRTRGGMSSISISLESSKSSIVIAPKFVHPALSAGVG